MKTFEEFLMDKEYDLIKATSLKDFMDNKVYFPDEIILMVNEWHSRVDPITPLLTNFMEHTFKIGDIVEYAGDAYIIKFGAYIENVYDLGMGLNLFHEATGLYIDRISRHEKKPLGVSIGITSHILNHLVRTE